MKYEAMMNICMALFHIFGANYIYIHPITNIFRVNGKYLCPYTVIVPAIKLGQQQYF